ncbi:MAG: phosphatidylserine decarboxylase family protein [Bacteroidales bacterium]|nr:phosphatidylserine decarboxylase family protein [Bacteroidales bacterium]
MIRTFGITIHKEGRKILFWLFVTLAFLNLLIWILAGHLAFVVFLTISACIFIFITNFFRSPKRIVTVGPLDIVAPADGKVVVVEKTFESGLLKEERIQVSIFMSIFNVHANWYPLEGKVIHYSHQKGNFMAAWLPKASIENERSTVLLRAAVNQQTVLIRQIAGAMARRIVTYAYTEKKVHLNEHLGFIKFGSRVDLFFPVDAVEILIKPGDKTTGNRTIIARWKAEPTSNQHLSK